MNSMIEWLESRRLLSSPGDLDTSFGTDGKVTITDFNGGANATAVGDAVQLDGKTVVVGQSPSGNFVVTRFNIDGTLDTSFGADQTGIVVTNMGSRDAQKGAFAVAIQSDGNIVVAGDAGSGGSFEGAVARYLSDGSLDTTFGSGGKVFVDFGLFTEEGIFRSIALQSDGKIVLCGSVNSEFGGSVDVGVARLNSTGKLDDSFGDGGTATFDVDKDDEGNSVAVDYSGTPTTNSHYGDIVVVGQANTDILVGQTDHNQTALVLVVKPNGSLDKGFDHDGIVMAAFPNKNYSIATGVAIESNGNIVVSGDVGTALESAGHDFFIARYLPTGALDHTFDQGTATPGYSINDFGGNDIATCMTPSSDSGFLVAGDAGIAKYTDNGLLDAFFGVNGVIHTDGAPVTGLAVGPGRRFVATGGAHFATERYLDTGANLVYATPLFDPTASEDGQDPASFYVYREENLPTATRVYFSVGGTATPTSRVALRNHNNDYTLDGMTFVYDLGGRITSAYVDIPANQTFTLVTLTPIDDTRAEGRETAIFTVLPDPSYEVGTPSAAVLTIKDNDGGSISGDVFYDRNASGDQNFGEPGLGGQTVYADLNNNNQLDSGEPSTTTDSGGNYDLAGLVAGTYTIRQIPQSGYRLTAPAGGAFTETLAVGQDVTGDNFGNTPAFQILGEVFQDTDGDGALDTNETGFEGARVYVDANGNNKFDNSELSTLSGPDGSYIILPLAAGTYKIRVVVPSGFSQTLPLNNGNYSVTIASGQIVTGKNFALKPIVAAAVTTGITGSVFNDLNVNAKRDVGKHTDPDDVGWRVWLDTNNNGVFDVGEPSHKTDGGGNFSFTKLKTGVVYHLRSELQSGWRRTTAAVFNITLSRNQVVNEKFGVTQKAAVSGILFNDKNSNKTQQTGEPGLSGWKVFIDTNDNGTLDPGEPVAITDAVGNWVIDDIVAGAYKVRTVVPSGWSLTTPIAGYFPVSLSDGQHVAHKAFGADKIA